MKNPFQNSVQVINGLQVWPCSATDSHLPVEREEQLAQSVAAVLMALNNQLTEMAQNAEKLNRKGWKTRKASTELVCGYIGEIAKAVEKLTPSVQAEPCRAVNTLG